MRMFSNSVKQQTVVNIMLIRKLFENTKGRILFGIAVLLIVLSSQAAIAQQDSANELTDESTNEFVEQLNSIEARIDQRRNSIASLETDINNAEGMLFEVLSLRLEREWIITLESGNEFATLVLTQEEESAQYPQFQASAVTILATHPSLFETALAELNGHIVFPESSMSAAEQALSYNRLFNLESTVDEVIALMMQTYSLQAALGVETGPADLALTTMLTERAINTSVYLDLSVSEADGITAALQALPGDVELIAKLTVINERIVSGTEILELAVSRLEAQQIDVTGFREQLVTITGKITPQLFNFGVIAGLLSSWGQVLIETIANEGPTFLFQVFVFFLIIYGFRKLSQLVENLTEHALKRSHVKLSRLLHSMIVATSSNLVLALGVLIALSQLGISLGPLLAGLGIAGFVIGFALQDTLSNFASGMMILFYKPFDVEDLVDLGGVFGTVDQMSLVNTTILTLDNQRITLPNSLIWGGVIKNVTAQKTRRVDLIFGIGYDDDIDKTEKILNTLVDEHELILTDPEPIVRLHELGESSLNFVVRAWTKTADYWDVYWDLLRSVKVTFDKEGISIPFPQRDLHLIKHDENDTAA